VKPEIYNALIWLNRPTIRTVIIGIVLLLVTFKVSALELLVMDDPECVYCTKFKEGAGSTYEQSEYQEWAPIQYITWSQGYTPSPAQWPNWFRDAINDGRIKPVNGTPMFILYDTVPGETEPREIGRIEGYVGGRFYDYMKSFKDQYPEWKAQFSN